MKYIQTNKFNEVSISVRTIFDLKKEDITTYHVLLMMMKSKSEKFPTKQALTNILSDTYGMRSSFGLTGYGKQLILEHSFRYINSSLINEEGYIPQVIEIMDQLLFHSVFDEETLSEAKYLLSTKLKRMEDDPDSLSIRTAFSLISDHSISIPVQGCLEDIETVTLKDVMDLYDVYKQKDKIIYVCGNAEKEVIDYLSQIDTPCDLSFDYQCLNTDQTYKKEIKKDISQTSLAQVYQTGVSIHSKDYYKLLVMNSVLGQSPSSLLYKHIREEKSLCYSINTSLIRFDGALLLHTGTFESAVDQVQEFVQIEIQKIMNKEISEEDVSVAKMDIIDGLVAGKDSPNAMIQQEFLNNVLKREGGLDFVIEQIQKVTVEDISIIASQLKLISTAIIRENQ